MPDFKIEFTLQALKTLDEIFDFILKESASVSSASNFIDRILLSIQHLSKMPYSGQLEPFLAEYQVRYIVEASYKIHYKISNSRIIITDIFHTRRNPTTMRP